MARTVIVRENVTAGDHAAPSRECFNVHVFPARLSRRYTGAPSGTVDWWSVDADPLTIEAANRRVPPPS